MSSLPVVAVVGAATGRCRCRISLLPRAAHLQFPHEANSASSPSRPLRRQGDDLQRQAHHRRRTHRIQLQRRRHRPLLPWRAPISKKFGPIAAQAERPSSSTTAQPSAWIPPASPSSSLRSTPKPQSSTKASSPTPTAPPSSPSPPSGRSTSRTASSASSPPTYQSLASGAPSARRPWKNSANPPAPTSKTANTKTPSSPTPTPSTSSATTPRSTPRPATTKKRSRW